MLTITQLKPGVIIEYKEQPHQVIFAQHSFRGRGGAVLRIKLKNLITGAIFEDTFREKDVFREADVLKKEAQFLYSDKENLNFMDLKTFEQIQLEKKIVGEKIAFLKEKEVVKLIQYKNKIIDVELPKKVDLRVISTEPGVKGSRETAGRKPATLETGLVLQVPLFINENDILRVNTETGEYVERVK